MTDISLTQNIIPFGFESFAIRVIPDDSGNPWFVAADVCEALTIGNHRDAVSRLDDDEKDGVGITDAIGREQETTIINESGLYSLILTSRKPEAKRFKKWVTSEVLPTIRKTGRYETKPVFDINSLSRLDIARMLLESETEKMALAEKNAALSVKIETDAPKVEVYDDFAIDEKTLRSVRETAKEINTKESEFRARLVSNKIIFKNLHGNYEPYAEFIERGYLRLREEVINGHFCRSPAFTNKGVIWIRNHKSFRDSFVLAPVIKRKAA